MRDSIERVSSPPSTFSRYASMPVRRDPRAREKRIARTRILWEHRRTLLYALILGGLFSGVVAFLLPKSYEATAKLMPPEQSSSGAALLAAMSVKGAGMLGGLAGDLLGVKGSGAVFVEILESRTVADRLIDQFQLARDYRTSKIEYTRKELERHTKIIEDRKSGVLTITVTDRNPDQAAAMAQAYVAELDRLVSQLSTSSARRERIFLEERLKTVKSELDNAAMQFSDFASKNTAIDIPAQGKAMVEAAAVLQGQLIAAEAQASGMEKIYTQNNVRMQAMNARIAELRAQLQKLGGGNTADEIKNENGLYPSIRKLPMLGVTYADLFRRTKIEETVFELLTQQYELAKVQEAKEIPSVKVLDAAVVPTVKTSPHRVLLTQLGALLITLLTAGWILFRKHWGEIDPSDAGKILAAEMAHSVVDTARRFAPASASAAVRNAVARARTRRDAESSSVASAEKSDAAGIPHASS